MRLYSLKFKLLLFIFCISIVLVGSVMVSGIINFNSYAEVYNNTSVKQANGFFQKTIENLKKESISTGTVLASNPTVIKAIEDKNSDKILESLKSILGDSNIDFVTVSDEKGDVLIRTHAPEKKEIVCQNR